MTQYAELLEQYRTQTFETTTIQGVSCAIRDTLLSSQHPTAMVNDEVHMDADYVFDASVDDMLGVGDKHNIAQAQLLCKALVRKFPQTLMFIFLP